MTGLAALSTAACRVKAHPLTVGGASAYRQAVVCEIIAQHLENRLRSPIARNPDLGGSLLAHEALTTGRIDLYPEGTGAALVVILKRPADPRPEVVLERVRLEYGNLHRLELFGPLGFSDGFVMVVRQDQARALRLETLSAAAGLQTGWQLAAGQEFFTRPDGMAALTQAYNLRLAAGPTILPPEPAYQALREGKVNLVAGNADDGQLRSNDFRVLPDDRQAFTPSQAVIVARLQPLAERPGLRAALNELSGRIAHERMQEMNHQVRQGRPPAALAAEFLREAGLVGRAGRRASLPRPA